MNGDAEQRVRLPSNRELLRMLAVIGLFVLGCYVLVTIRSALFDVFIAVFFAIVLEPLVRFLQHRLRLRRGFAVLLAHVPGAGRGGRRRADHRGAVLQPAA